MHTKESNLEKPKIKLERKSETFLNRKEREKGTE